MNHSTGSPLITSLQRPVCEECGRDALSDPNGFGETLDGATFCSEHFYARIPFDSQRCDICGVSGNSENAGLLYPHGDEWICADCQDEVSS